MLCDVMEMLTNLKCDALGRTTPELLRDTINANLKAFQKAYKGLGWRPKHHWAYHLWHMFKKFCFLFDLLVTERRHKIVKRWSKDKLNSSSFGRGLMEEVTLQHLADLAPPWLTRGLVDDVVPNATLMWQM